MSIKGFQFEGDETIHKYDYESLDNKLQFDETLTQTGKIPDSKKVGDAIADIQEDLTDISSDGVVPTARQLLSDKYAVDEEPYKYRASYSGDRMDDEIVGGSVVWNQLVQNGNFADTSIWAKVGSGQLAVDGNVGTLNITGTAIYLSQAINIPVSHVCLMSADLKSSTDRILRFSFGSNEIVSVHTANTSWTTFAKVHRKTSDSANANFIRATDGLESGDVINIKNAQLFDLTTMFGTEVADYIYNLEQANAGAGVAYFRKLFPNDYYEYDAGTLKHVEGVSAHDMVGFNQFDRSKASANKACRWATGLEIAENKSIVSTYIPIVPGNEYYCNYVACWFAYDADYNYVGAYLRNGGWVKSAGSEISRVTIPTDIGAKYMRVGIRTGSNDNINMPKVSDICINLSDPSRDGTYESYVKHSYPLDSSLTLRGILKVGDNGLYFDGDRYKADGTVERRYGIVDLGTLAWTVSSSTGNHFAYVPSAKAYTNSQTAVAICPKYNVARGDSLSNVDKSFAIMNNANQIGIHDEALSGISVSEFKSAMSGVMLVYELATPTTETAQPYTAIQTVDASGTEEYVSTSIVPVGHYTKYYDDLRKKLDSLPWNLDMIAPIETGTTASQAYAVGKYFLLNNQLCKAKTAIASGATFTLNTNYEVTTVADELYTALHA